MIILQLLKYLIQLPKSYISRTLKNLYIQCRNPNVVIDFPVIWRYDNYNVIKIASGVYIGAFSEIIVLEKTPYSKVSGSLTIEENSIIGAWANIRAGGGEIFIGRNSMLAQHVSLIAANHIISNQKPYRDLSWDESKTGIYIDENVWIGSGVTILPGCKIGKNSIIGAGSVITKNVPANEVWAGIPGKKLRSLDIQ
jgi:acetyltransferase-like isoleucine patch superfamily enzyme